MRQIIQCKICEEVRLIPSSYPFGWGLIKSLTTEFTLLLFFEEIDSLGKFQLNSRDLKLKVE